MQVAGHNLGVIMRAVEGIGTPRSLQGLRVADWRRLWGWLRERELMVWSWSVAWP